MFTLTLSSSFGSPLIAHQCCDQLTAVKTRYPLTSITWPYRGLRCRPIQFEYFLKLSADKLLVFKWTQAHIHMKCVDRVRQRRCPLAPDKWFWPVDKWVVHWTSGVQNFFLTLVLCLCHYGLPWVPEVFSRVRRGAAFRRPNAEDTRGSLFKTWPKPETAHEKPLEPRVTTAQHY